MSYAELPGSVTELEESVLENWRRERTFERSLEEREGAPGFVFWEGPPTANGRPGVHHVLSRTIKDLVTRHRAMTGHHVTRIAGWDTHGLPVEIEAERELGISGKPEIEAIGIERFNQVCRENLFTYKEEWERLSRRIGYWLDYDRAYITCSPEYVESVWWAVSRIHEEGLLYKGHKVLPWCPRCGTGLSSHEVAQGYRPVTDTAVTVAFPLVDDPEDAAILSWTTTPWTLPGNVALAVGEEIPYVRVRVTGSGHSSRAREGDVLILARERMEAVLRDQVEVLEELPGAELVGRRYRPPFEDAVDAGGSETAWAVLPADFVTVEEGTGVVHTAVMYGEDDFRLGREAGLPAEHTVGPDGRFLEGVPGGLAGLRVGEAETERRILAHLRERERLYRAAPQEHSYPHCWRCDTALLYMARDSWYVETTAVRDRLLAHNESIDWHPPEIGSGRMGEWLENNVDWALSRDRYWGTPLPVWECDEDPGHREVVGSLERLAERAGGLPEGFDPHRPEIDRIGWSCEREGCEGRMERVPQVLDAWFDSGSMPYAQWHYPFENEEAFGAHFPADFIAEGVDQTRGWFYSLLALSTLLFDRPAYRSVVVNDLVLDAEGEKMSKSRGNAVDPWEALETHGADVIRYYLIASSNPWLPKRWDPEALGEVERKLFATLRNTYRFFALYARLEGWRDEGGPTGDGRRGASGDAGEDARGGTALAPGAPGGWRERPAVDRWLLSRLDGLVGRVGADLEGYDPTRAARRISRFVVDELSNWYVRRTRDRFWATGRDDPGSREDTRRAFATLHEALRTTSLLLAPFTPFLSDWLHRELAGGSAHLADYPVPGGRRDPELEHEMEDARELAALGRAARERTGIRVRQPLRGVQVLLPEGRHLSPEVTDLLREELNVKEVEFLDASEQVVRLRARPDFGELGPRFGSDTPRVARGIEELAPEEAVRLRDGEPVELELDGRPVEIRPDEVEIRQDAPDELEVAGEGAYLVALDPALDPELRREGLAREVVSRVQRLRREAGLAVDDRIRLAVAGTEAIEEAVEAHAAAVARETLALRLEVGSQGVAALPEDGPGAKERLEVEGYELEVGLRRAARRPAGSRHGETESR